MNIHLLALPHTQTTWAYDLDGFNTATIRFATLLKRLGHTVLLYASEENDAPCDELITVVTKAEQTAVIKSDPYQYANQTQTNPLWELANPRMAREIGKRKQPRDVIALIGGGSQQPVTVQHPELLVVEYCIGYVGNFSNFRVFQSRAWQHYCYGAQKIETVRHFDAVIPAFYETTKFPSYQPEEYLVYVGRLTPRKGISIVCEAAKAAQTPLKVIGHGNKDLVTYGEYLGALHDAEKNEVVARAKALLCPTIYVEPFGGISPEAQLCGTPVISTDCGGFVETVEHGRTGYRCNIFGEFVDAITRVGNLDRQYIRQRAQSLYSMEAGMESFRKYFNRLDTLWDKGWNTPYYEVA